MTTQHDYKAALEDIQEGIFSHGNLTYAACVHALRFTDKTLKEPSLTVRMAGMKAWDIHSKDRKGNVSWPEMMDVVFKAMIAEILKEMER